jgi:hypothetical protein
VGELDIGAADHADGFDDPVGIILEPGLKFGGDGEHGRDAEGIAGVHPHGIDILDETDGDHPVFGVADHLQLEFLPAEDRFLDEDLVDHAGGKAAAGDDAQFFDVVDQSAAGAAEGVGGSDHDRVTEVGGDAFRLFDGERGGAAGHIDPQFVHGFLEGDAVFAFLDGVGLDADDPDAEAVEHAGALASCEERFRPVWPPRLGSKASGRSFSMISVKGLDVERLDVGGVGRARIGHDRGRVRVHQHDLVAEAAQGFAGLGAGIIELAGLADHDRSGTDDQDFVDVSAFGHGSAAVGVDSRGFGILFRPADKVTAVERGMAPALEDGVRIGGGNVPKTAGGELDRAAVGFGDFDAGHDLGIDERQAGVLLTSVDADGGGADVRAALGEDGVGHAGLGFDEVEADFEADAEAVEKVFPVRAADDERHALFASELPEFAFPATPEWPEMNVGDAPDVVALVDKHAAVEGLGVKALDAVTAGGMGAEIDRLVRVDEQDIDDRAIVADTPHGPGIGHRRIGLLLFGIKNREAAERRVLMEGDEWLPLGFAGARHREQSGSAILGARGRGAEHTFEHDVFGNVEDILDQVIAGRDEDDAAAVLGRCFHGPDKRSGVVGVAVPAGAEIPDVVSAGRIGGGAREIRGLGRGVSPGAEGGEGGGEGGLAEEATTGDVWEVHVALEYSVEDGPWGGGNT